eukprot:CAMPEP_0180393366 /NCGR_PEP_ID=MMETSP0989-20121125/33712_1 /TAXON_ID=697907 /ORGANISM="non described non described, Strain CCMP2293" /LENGTH=118 /DNA_ID=CAMNT_0022395247 /DNA_START=104 /DNA_END=456 /DNA_ORIENTATION=+
MYGSIAPDGGLMHAICMEARPERSVRSATGAGTIPPAPAAGWIVTWAGATMTRPEGSESRVESGDATGNSVPTAIEKLLLSKMFTTGAPSLEVSSPEAGPPLEPIVSSEKDGEHEIAR